MHGRSDSVAQMPSSTVIHPQMPLYLFRRDALLGFANQRQSHKPFGEGQVRIVEDRAASRAELLPTGQALVNPGALVLTSLAGNLGHATYFAAIDAA